MSFTPFDPLEFKNTKISDAAFGALRREINNILSSYVGWYDPFCELVQNALDAVEARATTEVAAGTGGSYKPQINIIIDLDQNSLTVSDNGIGLDKDKFEQFLAPNFSFKNGNTRGHKGVGATYVAYGFNYMRVTSKIPGFEASGRIVNARNWLKSETSGTSPKVEPDSSTLPDDTFSTFDRGVSITVRFDQSTHPRQLSWLQATTAAVWQKILYVKTGLGSVLPDETVRVKVTVVCKGKTTVAEQIGTQYPWLHKSAAKKASYNVLVKAQDDLYAKYGPGRKMPDKYSNLDFIYETWNAQQIQKLLSAVLDEEERDVLQKHTPSVSVEFGYTAKLWTQFNDGLGTRSRILSSGIQLAANNMPQGETILVPLTRNIGRQHQVHFLIHFDNYTPDLGRKGFHRELTDFSKSIARHIVETHLSKLRYLLKANTGTSPDLIRELAIDDWKKEMLAHENQQPLRLQSKHFFLPVERVSITSEPTREQDVIALFHQLIAGGVVRGLNMMSTNERFTYDGLFKIGFDLGADLYIYDQETNPLGVPAETAGALSGKVTAPRILEYKFSLDGLVEDLDSQDKNIKDVDLCVAWETGDLYREKFGIVSLLVPENADQRQYHGITHVLVDLETGAKYCDLIILSELISFLNDAGKTGDEQRVKYE
ncbi:ATP-binding protein [Pseudomonas aeruginosa]|uniref:ATP-binding protein n=1 Tax=Pseudomonadota TaxID=1224 RepID=UPI0012A7A7CE|nr:MULTISPECIES: ATP-binding protein [Pseudomonadota]MBP8322386.1 ATP-binding protein [Pseudomonas aeruginosa]CUR69130.1 HSP90 family protein [Achromobacter xylosoxidans]